MPPTILHISGPPASGKTTLAGVLAERWGPGRPYLVRFDARGRDGAPRLKIARPTDLFAESIRCPIQPDLVFEQVGETLKSIEQADAHAVILVETDAEPCFRHAYPYDVKVFILTPPPSLDRIFRSRSETVGAIERAMHDTTEFAAELFGLEPSPHDSAGLPSVNPRERRGASATAQTVEEFLDSDVGTEIASRLHLQPGYHAIIDSDVILLNEGIDHDPEIAAVCTRRIEALLEPLRRRLDRENWFAACDVTDRHDPLTQRGLRRIEMLLKAAMTRTP